MPLYRGKTLGFFSARAGCVSLTLISYLITAVGLPLPALAWKSRSRPFPCQSHACGCLSAEQCWEHCCCFTPEEKSAWAEAHGIEPPAYADRPTDQGWNGPRLRDQADGRAHPATKCSKCQSATSSTGQRKAKQCCQAATQDQDNPATTHWTPGVSARHCRGLSTVWVYAGAVPPPSPRTDGKPFEPEVERILYRDTSCSPEPAIPPDPPPRPAHA